MDINTHGLAVPKKTQVVNISHMLENITSSLYIKLECEQLTGSHKYRLAYGMLSAYLDTARLHDVKGFVESSSGNTGLAIAELTDQINKPFMLIANRGMNARIKRKIQKYKNVDVTIATSPTDAYIDAENYMVDHRGWVHLNQYDNLNAITEFEKMGYEILDDIPEVNSIVLGVGTGASIYGVARALDVRMIACTIDDDFGSIDGWKNLRLVAPGNILVSANEQDYIQKWKKFSIDELVASQGWVSEALNLEYMVNLSTVGNVLAAIEEANSFADRVVVTICTGYDKS